MNSAEVQAQVEAWRSKNSAKLIDCPISTTMSHQACRKRRDKLQQIRGLRPGTADGTWIFPNNCKGCNSLFEDE